MRARSGIINTVKTHKTVSLIVAALIVVGGVGTAFAFYPEAEPKKAVVTQQVAAVETQQEEIVAQEPAPVVEEQPVVEPEPEPEPESLKDEIKREVEAVATAKGLDNVEYQSLCMDNMIVKNGGYDDEVKAQYYADLYLVGKTNEQGQFAKMYFGTGCYPLFYTPSN